MAITYHNQRSNGSPPQAIRNTPEWVIQCTDIVKHDDEVEWYSYTETYYTHDEWGSNMGSGRESGGGGGGTTDYNALINKPQLNSIELKGNKTTTELGLVDLDSEQALSHKTIDCTSGNEIKNITKGCFADVTMGHGSGQIPTLENHGGLWAITNLGKTIPLDPFDDTLHIQRRLIMSDTQPDEYEHHDIPIGTLWINLSEEGGGSGTSNYNALSNKPQINLVTLSGNKTAGDLGLQPATIIQNTQPDDTTLPIGTIWINPTESGGGSLSWGNITGHIAAQTDLKNLLDKKLSVDCTESQLGFIVKVVRDGDDYKLSPVDAGTATTRYSDISGNISDNTTLQAAFDEKVDKITGKGLSSNDFTLELKTKLDEIETNAQKNVQSDWTEADTTKDSFIKNKPTIPSTTSQLTNDSTYQTSANVTATLSSHNTNLEAHQNLFDTKLNYNIGVTQEGKLLNVNSLGNVDVKSIESLSSNSLQTTDHTFVGAINELKTDMSSLSAATNIKVVSGSLPSVLENNTMYYVKRASSNICDIYMTTNEGGTITAVSLGSTEVDFTQYIKKTDIADNLVTDNASKVLSAKQGKILSDTKLDIYAGSVYSGKMLKVGTDGNISFADMPQSAEWGNVIGTITNQTDLQEALGKKLSVQYTSAQDDYVAKVDSADHKLKVMQLTYPNQSFGQITGSPSDNTNLSTALNAKLSTQYTSLEDGYIAKVDPSDHKLKVMAAGATVVAFSDLTGQPNENENLKTELDKKVNTTDIINNHTSTASDKPLAANQGTILYSAISEHIIRTNNPHNTSVNNLGDVDTASLADGKILRYNNANAKWVISDYINDIETASNDSVWSSAYVKSKLDALASQVPIVVAATQPATPRQDTLYFIGTASPYQVKLYGMNEETSTYQWYDMGTTSIDLSDYIKKEDVVDNLTSTDTDKPLSAKQGKVLAERKATIYFSSSEPEGIQAGDYWATPDGTDSGIYGTEIKVTQTSTDTIDVALNKKQDKNGLEQIIYNVVYPVGKVLLQYTDSDNPNTLKPSAVTATWTDITSTVDLRFFQANNTSAAGTKLDEQLPNIKGVMNSPWLSNYGGTGALSSTASSGGTCGSYVGDIGYGVSLNAHNGNSVYTDNGVVRPLTSTVKVWKRTA